MLKIHFQTHIKIKHLAKGIFNTYDKNVLNSSWLFAVYYTVMLQKSCVIGYVGNMLVQTAPLFTVELLNVK